LGGDKIEQRLARMEKEGGESKEKEKGESKEKDKAADKEKESADDPQFVKDLLSLHDKFINVVNNEFCGNALFQKALKDAFVEVEKCIVPAYHLIVLYCSTPYYVALPLHSIVKSCSGLLLLTSPLPPPHLTSPPGGQQGCREVQERGLALLLLRPHSEDRQQREAVRH
jgi:hypothetical protein